MEKSKFVLRCASMLLQFLSIALFMTGNAALQKDAMFLILVAIANYAWLNQINK